MSGPGASMGPSVVQYRLMVLCAPSRTFVQSCQHMHAQDLDLPRPRPAQPVVQGHTANALPCAYPHPYPYPTENTFMVACHGPRVAAELALALHCWLLDADW